MTQPQMVKQMALPVIAVIFVLAGSWRDGLRTREFICGVPRLGGRGER